MLKLLIANRGEIACRILKACREKNTTAAVITTAEDKHSLACQKADVVFEVDSFLNAKQIIEHAKNWGAHLIHPGYGFLSENSEFAKICENNKIIFIGPTSKQIKMLGVKESSKKIAQLCGIPTLPSISSVKLKKIPHDQWKKKFEKLKIHPPYLIKANSGGGGRGMRIVNDFSNLQSACELASHEALVGFNDATVFIEHYLNSPRHIEIQVFGDGKGKGVFFGERECSLQRRHQKIIEESPCSILTPQLREKMGDAALSIVSRTKYRGAGTVEFLLDEQNNFYFLEMNTRLQVEHPVTEMVYGIDLVHAQIDLALGKHQKWTPKPHGVAFEARILAEDPRQNFTPTPGSIEEYIEPQGDGIRVDSGVSKGSVVLPIFDSLIAKLVVHAENRELAIQKMNYALKNYFIFGVKTNLPFLISLVNHKKFVDGDISTHFIEEHLDELNQLLISKKTLCFFESFSCREALFEKYKLPTSATLATTQSSIASSLSALNKNFPHITAFSKQTINSSFLSKEHLDFDKIQYYLFLNSKGQMEVNINGDVIVLENPLYYNQQTAQPHESNKNHLEIKSPLSGKVYDILVHSNDVVQKGDLLFMIESMKMQIEVRASVNGIIKNIFVQKGEIVLSSKILAEFE